MPLKTRSPSSHSPATRPCAVVAVGGSAAIAGTPSPASAKVKSDNRRFIGIPLPGGDACHRPSRDLRSLVSEYQVVRLWGGDSGPSSDNVQKRRQGHEGTEAAPRYGRGGGASASRRECGAAGGH